MYKLKTLWFTFSYDIWFPVCKSRFFGVNKLTSTAFSLSWSVITLTLMSLTALNCPQLLRCSFSNLIKFQMALLGCDIVNVNDWPEFRNPLNLHSQQKVKLSKLITHRMTSNTAVIVTTICLSTKFQSVKEMLIVQTQRSNRSIPIIIK